MTQWGAKIPATSLEELKEHLVEEDDDGKAVKRLFTAIAYKHGQSPAAIEEMYGIPRQNVYQWLDRIEDRGLPDGLYDESKPGRPAKLTDEQFDRFVETLRESPRSVGYDVEVWDPKRARHWLNEQFDIEYTLRHVRRLMTEAGLTWRTARPHHYKADPEEVEEFEDTSQKNSHP